MCTPFYNSIFHSQSQRWKRPGSLWTGGSAATLACGHVVHALNSGASSALNRQEVIAHAPTRTSLGDALYNGHTSH